MIMRGKGAFPRAKPKEAEEHPKSFHVGET